MKIVLDTNVLVSAILKPSSKPALILNGILSRRMTLLVSSPILKEYEEVLGRKEFLFNKIVIHDLLHFFKTYAEEITIYVPKLLLPDEDDIPFLACALAGKADGLITGNRKHFPEENCRPVKVFSPSEFLERLNPQEK